jgi:hypothetical protein
MFRFFHPSAVFPADPGALAMAKLALGGKIIPVPPCMGSIENP